MSASMSIFNTPIRVILAQIIQESKQAAEQRANQKRIKLQKKKRNEKTRLQYKRRSLEATVQANAEQNAESTQEKPGHGQVIRTKNTASFSTISRLIVTQDVKNNTQIWPTISAYLHASQWHAFFAMTKQEEDLLERSQPNHEGFWPIRRLQI